MYTPKPFNEGFLPEEDGHAVYYAQYGNADGEAIVSFHGGPGSQSRQKHAQRFDLQRYRIVLFDQRGCGNSTPHGNLEENTTQKLISDAERLREQLEIENWFVSGSSWGSALALVYAQTHPDRTKGLLLSAIFLADTASMDWSFQDDRGTGYVYTDAWEELKKKIAAFGTDPKNAAPVLLEKIVSGTEEERHMVAAAMANWEGNLLISTRDVSYVRPEEVSEGDIASAKIFLHYEANGFFLELDQIINNTNTIKHIPMVIVHGRHDILCPFVGAWKLHNAHGDSKMVTLPQSNHQFSADGVVAMKYIFEAFLKDFR